MVESSRPSDVFPERLKAARQVRELSQDGLAKLANMQPSAISHFETGTRKPSFDNLRRLADALDVTTDYLLGRVNEMQDVVGSDRVHRHLDQLSSADREMAEDFLKMLAKRRVQQEE